MISNKRQSIHLGGQESFCRLQFIQGENPARARYRSCRFPFISIEPFDQNPGGLRPDFAVFQNLLHRNASPIRCAEQSKACQPHVTRALHDMKTLGLRRSLQLVNSELHSLLNESVNSYLPSVCISEEFRNACPDVEVFRSRNQILRAECGEIRVQPSVKLCADD